MKKAVVILMVLTIVSKFIGFFRDVILAYFYGASGISDAYLISMTIPVVIFGVIAKGISTGYIPMYSRIEEEKGKPQAIRYTNNLMNVLLVFCSLIVAAGLFFTEPIVKVFASGFEGETLQTAVGFTRVTIVGIYFTVLIRILSAYLNYKRYFAVPNLLGIPMSIIVILSIMISYQLNVVELLSFGYVAALLVQFLILLFFSYKKGYQYKPTFDMKDEHIRKMLVLAVPVILGSMVHQINRLVDRTLASQISTGGISALNYATTLNGFVHGVFVTSIGTVMYPMISKMASRDNIEGLKHSLYQSIVGISILIVPATVGSMLFAEPIVRMLFDRGAFDAQAVTMTSTAFFFYSIGMLGTGLRVILSKAFFSLQDTRTPMINAAIAMALNIVLNIILSRYLGLGGLALATSISAIFCTILLFYNLRAKLGSLNFRRMIVSFLKVIAASITMGILAKVIYHSLLSVINFQVSLMITIIAAGLLYFLFVYLLKIEGIEQMTAGIRRRLKI
ncbi:murein biosynthesis integral membrane protein MurJ [Halobacillus andaensis]|nr:murein biosynthesis integral membrane protein MurJ [Halobacillus andaensis]MBP2005775.1 putative peptidoglycan lipid II flippase [Halobacillus andaensis]